jgi:hypothetical protein
MNKPGKTWIAVLALLLPIVLAATLPITVWYAAEHLAPPGRDTKMAAAYDMLCVQGMSALCAELFLIVGAIMSRKVAGRFRWIVLSMQVIVFTCASASALAFLFMPSEHGNVPPTLEG